ncbi:hypothetical protein RGUI_3554 [Rhodovulum sp. P5]|nr:hypothetical protein RGUI_3554 [Rhodovulum sp. P5]
MLASLFVAIASGGLEHPIPLLDSRFHLLDCLASVLFTLQLALRREDRLDEFPLRRIFKAEIQALDPCAAALKLPPQLDMKLGIPCKALEIVEDDHVVLVRLRLDIAEQRHHAGTFHEIAAAAHIVREDGFDVIALLAGILAAAMLLTVEAAARELLLRRGHAAVNDSFLVCNSLIEM